MPIPPEKIIQLAQKSGFDAELRAASIARKAGFSVRQSIYFNDKDEGKGRELDLQATTVAHNTHTDPKIWCSVELSIEVKKTQEPFIFFTSVRETVERGEGYAMIRFTHNVDNKVLPVGRLDSRKPLSRPVRLARTYVGAKNGGQSQIFSGVISAVKAALHSQETCEEVYNDTSRDIVLFVPMMVVDGPICEVYLDEDSGELKASEVDEVVYVQNYMSENYGEVTSQVVVVTMDRFERILPAYAAWATSVKEHLFQTRLDPVKDTK